MRSTNKQANEKVSDAQSHKGKYEGAHVTAGSYLQQTVSKGPDVPWWMGPPAMEGFRGKRSRPGKAHKEASMTSGGKIKGVAGAGQGKSCKAGVAKRARLGVWKPCRPTIRLLVFLLFRKQWHFQQGNREAEWDCHGPQIAGVLKPPPWFTKSRQGLGK